MAWRILSAVGTTAVAVGTTAVAAGTTGVAVSEAGKNYKRRGSCTAIFRGPARREDSAGCCSSWRTFVERRPDERSGDDPRQRALGKSRARHRRRKEHRPGDLALARRGRRDRDG